MIYNILILHVIFIVSKECIYYGVYNSARVGT